MTLVYQLKRNFPGMSQERFHAKSATIVGKWCGQPALSLYLDPLPDYLPSRDVLRQVHASYEIAYEAATDGGRTARDQLQKQRAQLTTIFEKLIAHCESVATAAQDIRYLDVTGFDLRRRYARSASLDKLPAPAIRLVRGQVSGTVIVRAGRIDGAGSYEVQACSGDPSKEANWQTVLGTARCRHMECPGLTPGTLYYFRVRAIGSQGAGGWSDVASLIVT